MGHLLTEAQADGLIAKLREKYDVYAPKLFPGTGRFSETDVVRYDTVEKARDIVFDKKSDYSFKTALLPPNSTLFYFTECTYFSICSLHIKNLKLAPKL